jgi:hypothetical protein
MGDITSDQRIVVVSPRSESRSVSPHSPNCQSLVCKKRIIPFFLLQRLSRCSRNTSLTISIM